MIGLSFERKLVRIFCVLKDFSDFVLAHWSAVLVGVFKVLDLPLGFFSRDLVKVGERLVLTEVNSVFLEFYRLQIVNIKRAKRHRPIYGQPFLS